MSKVSPTDYAAALLAAAAERPTEVVEQVETLVATLRRAGRLRVLPRIIAEAEKLFEQEQGIWRIGVTTAAPLNVRQKNSIAKSLGITPARIRWDECRDPRVGTGVRLTVGDWVFDGTTDGALGRLRRALSAPLK